MSTRPWFKLDELRAVVDPDVRAALAVLRKQYVNPYEVARALGIETPGSSSTEDAEDEEDGESRPFWSNEPRPFFAMSRKPCFTLRSRSRTTSLEVAPTPRTSSAVRTFK